LVVNALPDYVYRFCSIGIDFKVVVTLRIKSAKKRCFWAPISKGGIPQISDMNF